MLDITYPRIIFIRLDNRSIKNIDAVLEAKLQEEEAQNNIFWGYTGNTCHPTTQVQPFSELDSSTEIKVVMSYYNSIYPDPKMVEMTEFSIDKKIWSELPAPTLVPEKAKYAFVMRNLTKCDMRINLQDYHVAVGDSLGVCLSKYLLNVYTTKACAIYHKNLVAYKCESHVSWVADLVYPYGIFVR